MTTPLLTCIDLDQPTLTGFRQFISAWLYRCDSYVMLVDPGPLSTIKHLCRELRNLGVTRLDYLLLTHIHIDHAGGAGELLKEFPEATVICHPDGIDHMVNPQKLWAGSRKVLGQLAETYGVIMPIPADRIRFEERIGATGVRSFLTPGHAQHHCSFLLNDLLFAGEVAGVRGDVPEGIYMRPATPPRFILKVALDSLDRMIALTPQRMVFAHYGLIDNASEHLEIARKQLLLWVRGAVKSGAQDPAKREAWLTDWLLARDHNFALISALPSDIQERERYFLGNTLRGMIEFVDGLSDGERAELCADKD